MLLYGGGPKKIAYIANVPVAEARAIIEKFKKDAYPTLIKWLDDSGKRVVAEGEVELYGGYRRRFRPSGDKFKDAGYVRSIVNSLIQGTSAYITKYATLAICNALDLAGIPYKLIILIHDSITIQVPKHHATQAYQIVDEAMKFDLLGVIVRGEGAIATNMSKEYEQTLDDFLNELED